MPQVPATETRRVQGSDSERRARGMRQFVVGIVGYAVVIALEGILVRSAGRSFWLGLAMSAVPMALAVWAMAGCLEAIRTFDELQQKIFAESGLLALAITAVATFTYGFLEVFIGLPKLSMFFVFPFMAFCFVLSLPVVMRRYR